jgi:pimeloyl-ACP methyl ester carboxylesterase
MKPKRVLALVIFAALAAVAASAWAPDRTVESLKPRWAAAPSRFETIDGMAVHLRDQGPRDDPHPLVLIHGTSSSLHAWDAWAARLQGGHRVLSFDLPGFGLTGPFPNDDYSMAHYTRFMSDLLAHLGISHAVLVGNSLGGHVAWETALAHPELVERLARLSGRSRVLAGRLESPAHSGTGLTVEPLPAARPGREEREAGVRRSGPG